jgi:uncharacterized membrane protein YadS
LTCLLFEPLFFFVISNRRRYHHHRPSSSSSYCLPRYVFFLVSRAGCFKRLAVPHKLVHTVLLATRIFIGMAMLITHCALDLS